MLNYHYLSDMNNIDKMTSQEMSFIDIFDKYGYTILVPAIQRDYAQGRSTAKATKIRKDFVEELIDYIFDENSHSLDFIYGDDNNKFFIPLDGQQRLTTLWLLHLYLGCMTGRKEQIKKFIFNYETRDSSARFCKKLLENADKLLILEKLKKKHENKEKYKPSEIIKDEDWWFTKWPDDPTISGILTMLDEIDNQFYDYKKGEQEEERYVKIIEAGEKLFDNQTKPIVFQFMPLNGIHDIDDLYIKMNARGLELTPFEIFKSKLIEDVEKHFDSNEEKVFKSNIDVKWSDTLWKYRGKDDKNIDVFLERTFRVIIANEGSLSTTATTLNGENLDYIFEANNKHLTFAHNWFEKRGIEFNFDFLKRTIVDLSILFDGKYMLLGETDVIPGYDVYWFDIAKAIREWIIGGKSLTYDSRLKLHAYLKFQEKFPNANSDELSSWMRLIHNLIEATPIDNSVDMVKALKGVEIILGRYKNSGLTLDVWLNSQEGSPIDFYASYQWQEEIVKAKLRLSNTNWNAPLKRAEQQNYLKGQIGVTLYLAGVYVNFPQSMDLSNTITANDYDNILNKVLPIFEEIGNADSDVIQQFAMVKAMLAKGDYMPWLSSGRKNLYNRSGHRDYSWKRLFRADEKANMTAYNCLKEIVFDSNYDATVLSTSLNAIANQYSGNSPWIKILVGKYGHKIMQNSKQGFIAFDDKNVLIYQASQRNHYHSELYTLALYHELKEMYKTQKELGKVTVNYESVKSGDDDSYVVINNYYIYHWIKNNEAPWIIEEWINENETQKKISTDSFNTKDEVLNFINAKLQE